MREQAGNVLFLRPAGWQRHDNPDGTVTLTPPGVSPREVALTILQGGPLQGDLRAWFDGAWQAILQANGMRVVDGGDVQTGQGDDFQVLSTRAVLQPTAGGGHTYAAFFAAAPGGRVEAMLFFAVNEGLYDAHIGAVTALWETARFANLEGGGQPVAATPPATPQAPSQGDLQVDRIYVRFATNIGPASERYRFDFLVLYTNGLVYNGGAGRFTQGPHALELDNESVRQYNLGTYRITGNELHIAWSGAYAGQTAVYQIHQDGLDEGTGPFAWRRLPSLDGLRLQGTYVPASPPVDPTRITFAPDGTFSEQGVIGYAGSLYFLEQGLTPPSGGSGTYTIQDWTLTLRYTDGSVVTMFCFVLPDDDPRQPRQLLINTYFFQSQR